MSDTLTTEQFDALRELMRHAPAWLDVYDNEIGAEEEDKKALERAQKAISCTGKPQLCHFCSLPVDLSKGTVKAGEGIAHLDCALDPRRPNRLDYQWIPVSERLPEKTVEKLVLLTNGEQCVAFISGVSGGWIAPGIGIITHPTHWMDLPEPPQPPKPADPFEAWLDKQLFRDTHLDKACFYTPDHKVLGVNTAKWVWNAAKEHYAKPMPDFETWWNTLRPIPSAAELRDVLARHVEVRVAQHIWNAAQGKPEAQWVNTPK